MGVKVIRSIIRSGSRRSSRQHPPLSDQQDETMEVNDFIYKSKERKSDVVPDGADGQQDSDLMEFHVFFGNQNIKEDKISRQESTQDFIDQEIYFHFRPITTVYRHDLI